ncbi:MAG: DUF433 domain-containing protein [Magnetococcales bacterium]|nr:DUF433 domain-containing protein [Magnetococcales bacterium]
MSRIEKTLDRMRNNPNGLRIDSLKSVASHHGIEWRQKGTSHVVFLRTDGRVLPVPAYSAINLLYIKEFLAVTRVPKSLQELQSIFGEECQGETAEDCARTSLREFVRHADRLEPATAAQGGHRLTAWEALSSFGIRILEEISKNGLFRIEDSQDVLARTLNERMALLGLSVADLARHLGRTPALVEQALSGNVIPDHDFILSAAQALALDETKIGFSADTGNVSGLGFRLRELAFAPTPLRPRTVLALGDAGWLAGKQGQLERWLAGTEARPISEHFQPDPFFGDRNRPAWRCGYDLAGRTREKIGLDPAAPIPSLRDLIENQLHIPVICLELPLKIAGATIANGSFRGIILNIRGHNANEFIRRSTMAHEFGHLLWDPDERLSFLRVDLYEDIARNTIRIKDPVEARANAFAVELLAPQNAMLALFRQESSPEAGLGRVMGHFGISSTSARNHLINAARLRGEAIAIDASIRIDAKPTDEWKARESFTLDWFPLKDTPPPRRGRFALLVGRAFAEGLVSLDSACAMLRCSHDEFLHGLDTLFDLFNHAVDRTLPERLRKTPNVCGGVPCLGATRIPVWMLEYWRRSGATAANLKEYYPSLDDEDLQSAWSYVRHHRDEIERHIQENVAA